MTTVVLHSPLANFSSFDYTRSFGRKAVKSVNHSLGAIPFFEQLRSSGCHARESKERGHQALLGG
jgi:hypothetical protein